MTQAMLESELAPFFTTKAPFQFPENFKAGFVKYWPIVSLVILILAIPAILAFLGLGAAFMPAAYAGGAGVGMIYTITIVLTIASTVLGILALPGLFNKTRSGWVFSYYAQLISILGGILSFSILGVIFGLLWLMLLFQVRDYYK